MEILDYFYTESQVAELLNVNRITVWRWIKSGKFRMQRVGRMVPFYDPIEQLDEMSPHCSHANLYGVLRCILK